jgi:hypothetical protein
VAERHRGDCGDVESFAVPPTLDQFIHALRRPRVGSTPQL